MLRKFNNKGIVLGTLVLGSLAVWLLIIVILVGSEPTIMNSYYLPVISYEFTELNWTEVGVPDVIEYTFEIDPNDPRTLYVGTYGQQAWRSHDSGQSWATMEISPSVMHYATTLVSPTLIYAATAGWPYQVYRSLDGGDSWEGLSRVHAYRLISFAVNPVTPTIVYAGAGVFDSPYYGGEVYRSIDGGNSWAQILPSFTLAMDIVVDPQNPQVVYLGGSHYGLFKSVDSGYSWQTMNNGLPSNNVAVQEILVHPEEPERVYIIADGRLYRSSNSGNSWTSIGADLPGNRVSGMALDPDSPEVMFAAPFEGDDYYGIYQSDDGGDSWRRVAFNPVDDYARKISVQGGAETSLFVLFDGYPDVDGRFWKLDLEP